MPAKHHPAAASIFLHFGVYATFRIDVPTKPMIVNDSHIRFAAMSWLDPDRLAALFGKKPLGKAVPAPLLTKQVVGKSKSKDKKKEKEARKSAEKAAKKAEKEVSKQSETVAPKRKRKPECCEKYKKGKRCKDCPLV